MLFGVASFELILVMNLSLGMGMQVVAEGVETDVHHAALAKMSISALQGYYIARPMDKDALLGWLVEHNEAV